MNTQRITRWAFALAVGTALGSLAAGPAAAQAPLKVGFVYVSPIGDAGWTFQHDQGRKEMEKALAGKVETKYVENVPEGPDAERVIREFAANGYKLVFTTSFGYMNPTIKVAQQFPNTVFLHATGYKTAKNVGIYNARFYEGRYVLGQIAAKESKKGLAGYIVSFPIPEVNPADKASVFGDPLQDALFDQFQIEVPVMPWPEPPKRLLRISAQLYNSAEEYERLAAALVELFMQSTRT